MDAKCIVPKKLNKYLSMYVDVHEPRLSGDTRFLGDIRSGTYPVCSTSCYPRMS